MHHSDWLLLVSLQLFDAVVIPRNGSAHFLAGYKLGVGVVQVALFGGLFHPNIFFLYISANGNWCLIFHRWHDIKKDTMQTKVPLFIQM